MVLGVFVVPIAIGFYLSALTRVDVAMIRTKRHAERVQARLLAESAFALAEARIADGRSVEDLDFQGELEGAGFYRCELAGEGSAQWLLLSGEVRGLQGTQEYHVIATLEARLRIDPTTQRPLGLIAVSVVYRLEPVARGAGP